MFPFFKKKFTIIEVQTPASHICHSECYTKIAYILSDEKRISLLEIISNRSSDHLYHFSSKM